MNKRLKQLKAKKPGEALIIGCRLIRTQDEGEYALYIAMDEYSQYVFKHHLVPAEQLFDSLPQFIEQCLEEKTFKAMVAFQLVLPL